MTRSSNAVLRRGMCALGVFTTAISLMSVAAPAAVAEDVRSRQWHLDAMQAESMWDVSTGEGITVAVIDSGVNDSLPELRGQVIRGKDVSNNPTGVQNDSDGHGTAMAGLIAGTGAGSGIQGLAPGAKILAVKDAPNPKVDAAGKNMGKAIRYAADSEAQIINVSAGAMFLGSDASNIKSAVSYALSKGKLIFASTGNDGDGANIVEKYPASLPGVVGVGAIDKTRSVTNWSSHGSHVTLAAPGDEMFGRCSDGRLDEYCVSGGTSHAAAIASASAALIWSEHPDWTANQVLRVMMETAGKPTTGKVPSKYIGYGIVRPRKVLLDGEGDPGPADVSPLAASDKAAEPDISGSSSAADKGGEPQSDQKSTASGKATESVATSPILWIGFGVFVLIAAASTVVFLRARRNT